MSFVEAITGEFLHEIKNIGGRPLVDAARGRTLHEDLALLGHLLGFFLAHGTAQDIGASERVAGQHLGDLHHLLLIENHAVRRFENMREIWMQILHGRPPLLAVDEIVHHARLQRSRAEKRHQGDDIGESIRLQAANQIFHTSRFELKNRRGRAGLDELEGRRIICRDGADFDRILLRHPTTLVDGAQSTVDDRQGAQSEKIEFDQTHCLDVVFVELGDQCARAPLTIQGHEVRQRRWCNHDPGSVKTDVSGQSFELAREVHDIAHVFLVPVPALQRLLGQCSLESDSELIRNQVGKLIHVTVRVAEDSACISHHGLRRHAAESDDLGNALSVLLAGSVALDHVIDDLVPTIHAEIDVEIRHRYSLRIQEALEQQLIFNRVQIGDTERIGDQ